MKKSIVISLLTVATLLCTALCSFASTGIVTTDTLRLRKEPSTDSATLALLSENDEIEILGEDNGWYKVKCGENEGYVAAQYINVLANTNTNTLNENGDINNENSENTNTNEPANVGSQDTKKVLVAGEKVYITPLINALVINTIESDTEIEIVSEIKRMDLCKNRCNNRLG